MVGVLDGVRVLDLSSGIAGPISGMLLSDHGADVIKIEPPGGDPFRDTPGYATWLRGRRSMELDLTAARDHQRFLALVRDADVVLESYAPGTTARLGITPDTLLAHNPRLIHCTVSAYGGHPGHAGRPGYDALVAARLGILDEQRGHLGGPIPHMNGEGPFLPDLEVPDGMAPGAPREGPIFTATPWLSMCAGFLATTGISAALFARLHTGRGQHVETSLLQAALSITASKWQRAEHHTTTGYRTWIYDSRAPKGFYRCSDGRWVQQWVPNPLFALSSADGDELAFRSGVGRVRDDPGRIPPDPENIVVLGYYHQEMAAAFARFPSAEWTEVARQAGVPLQPVRTPEEALADPALLAEAAVVDVEHPEHGTLRQAGILYGLSTTPGRVQRPVPRVGEHNSEGWQQAPPAPGAVPPQTERAPLNGVTVLDLGFAVAGPFATQVLADLGATVIKVNNRTDPWWHATHIAYGVNRGKRSIGIDLKHPDGIAAFHRLVERADVVHSNMRRDALSRLGCDEESLRAVNPDLIYCHTRGFDRGPRSDSPGNDQTGCSLAGVTFEDGGGHDGGTPFWSLTSLGDTGNGFLSVIGVLQALYHRHRTGEPQAVDTSILNAGLLLASAASVKADGTSLPRPQLDRMQLGLGPFYRLYRTADGWICLAAVTELHRERLGKALGTRAADLAGVLEREFAALSTAAAFALLDGHDVPVEIADAGFSARLFDDQQMWERGLVVAHDHPQLGRVETFGSSITFSETPGRIQGPPPLCGQHTRDILTEHGFAAAEIDRLVASGAVFEEIRVG